MVEAVTASTPKETVKRTLKDYRSEVKPTWCPGCGDFGVLSALQRTLAERNLDPKDIVIVSGIGCSGRLPEFVNAYGLHVVHGRALPTAQGVKAANPDLTVIAVGGDGDGFAIGGGHVPHAVRRNQDITYVLMDNQVYGLTKGQPSPTTPTGMAALQRSSSMPKMAPYEGVLEGQLNMLAMILVYGCTFVARTFSSQATEMSKLIGQGLDHHGFSFIHAMSPCPTFYNTYDPWKESFVPLPEDWDTTDRIKAIDLTMEEANEGMFHSGIFYQEQRPTYMDKVHSVFSKAHGDQISSIEDLMDQYA
ncbi:MAG TPA: 2-oxoacid:ferredoxin oxidoreductase subunit beta [candidate division Zixibacteria bacterium]|nr:2-oxoacid:ferredoxin oxidoreductase subunit beta [candidate division Zixibacteria bacterium]